MKNELTAKRLNLALDLNNMKPQDLSEKSGVSKSSVSQYRNGTYAPSNLSAGAMGEVLGVDPMWLMGFDVPMTKEEVKGDSTLIPVLGRVAAGVPIEAVEDIIDMVEISPSMAKSGEYFALKIHGDSMFPTIKDNDTVIVRKQETAETSDIVIASINGNDATCKKIRFVEEGVILNSINPDYEPMFFSKKQVSELPVRIWGKVVQVRTDF